MNRAQFIATFDDRLARMREQIQLGRDGVQLLNKCPKCGSSTYTECVHVGGEGDVWFERCGADKLTHWCDWDRRLLDWRGLPIPLEESKDG